MKANKLMHFKNAREPQQLSKMLKAKKLGVCPFCPKYYKEFHTAPIIKENKNWILTKNDYPYDGSKIHLLLIHKKHIEKIKDLKSEASKELFEIISWVEKEFKINGGSVFMRFGNIKYTGATISHLHAHIIMGTKEGRRTEKLKVPVGFKKI